MKFGVHVSIAGSISNAVSKAQKLGCDTFQIFTRNPRSWLYKNLNTDDVTNFKELINRYKIKPVYSHMPYLPNLSSFDDIIHKKSLESLKIELNRCDCLEIPYIVTHLGSAKGHSKSDCINKISKSLDTIFQDYNGDCKLLLENTAGKNNKLGSKIDDLCEIISIIDCEKFIGICFDTCHAFASGYDIRNKEVIQDLMYVFEKDIKLDKLKLIHCNDSLFDLGSGRDRHEHLGLGKIGKKGFLNLLSEDKLREIPFICETPIDERRDDVGNLNYLHNLYKQLN